MDRPLQQMTLGEYAEFQVRFGVKIVHCDGGFWRQVRPFFYRPLLPVELLQAPAVSRPVGWPGGFQYIVAQGSPANSTMNFVMVDDPQNYSLEGLSHKRRQLIKRSAQDFEVRPVDNPKELKESGHPVYLSFFERTRYAYKSDRQTKVVFDRWVDTLFSTPKTILLGGYGPDGLRAISTSSWVNHTLVYSTLICETAALKKNLGELMFHEVRRRAARQPLIKQIFVRPYQGGNSLDEYYLFRGCRLARMPARLEMSTAILNMIRWTMPRQYKLLIGED